METLIKQLSSPSIAEGRIKVTTLDGSPDDGHALRAAIKKASTRSPAGASFRWAVNTSKSGDTTLQVKFQTIAPLSKLGADRKKYNTQ